MKTIIVAIVFCTAVFIGCGDSVISPPSSVQSYEYYPLQIGNSWRYKETNAFGVSKIYKLTVVSTQVINGKTYFKISSASETEEREISYGYKRIDNGKLYFYADGKDKLYIDFEKRDTTVGYVVSMTDNVSSSVGAFNKVKNVEWIMSKVDGAPFNTYAPNVGMLESGMRGHRVELISAKIGDKVYP